MSLRITRPPTEADRQCARDILAGFVYTTPPADSETMVAWVANQIASYVATSTHTPNADLPPLDPTSPKRELLIHIDVPANWEERLDMQWVVEREIAADRWGWSWPSPGQLLEDL